MTTERDFDRIARAWLDLMPVEVPDGVIEAVMLETESTPQVRGPFLHRRGRSPQVARLLLVAAVAALGVALLGGVLLTAGARLLPPPATAVPGVTVAPGVSPTVSPSQVESPSSSASPAPAALRADWIAEAPTGTVFGELDEPIKLVVNGPGSSAWVANPAGNYAFGSTAGAVAPDAISVILDRDGWDCPAGAAGRYRWSVSPDDELLTLTAIEDECPGRAVAFARTWARTHIGTSRGGSALITGLGPLIRVTLPPGSYTSRPLVGVHEITDVAQDQALLAFRDPQAFADPCATGLQPWAKGARAFIDALRRNPAMGAFNEEPMEIGGYPAIHLTLLALPDHPPCEPDHPFYQWTPRTDPGGQWWLSAGDRDSMYIVDHPDATLLFQVLPIGTDRETEVISSISFPEALTSAP